ncbi:MAG: CTP synthase [bacterium]|nr:CTP synthase [bacterium]MDZ4299712.1 CTP synthase [Candidatus Sungbacteria bacterium]
MAKYIFVCGGVISGVGKGITTSSIALLLQSSGYRVSAIKIDPYINVDAGTIRPTEHGEVFVTDDGMETDQDIGNYERFLNHDILGMNYMTTGSVYLTVIQRERNLEYNGTTVEVVPHIPHEIIRRIEYVAHATRSDFVLIEIGGTVGEYQNLIFLEAARMMRMRSPQDVLFVLVSYLPVPPKIGEMKTKPTQLAARMLNEAGIQANIIVCRSDHPIDIARKEKISLFCNIGTSQVISAPDVDSIYEVPLNFADEHLTESLLAQASLPVRTPDMLTWHTLVETIRGVTKPVRIAIVGKYFQTGDYVLSDSYISVIEAIKHASWKNGVKSEITWLNAEEYEQDPSILANLDAYDGVIVPGGFGRRGVEGKIFAVQYVREHKIPYLGLCYGLQMAVIEFARNVCGMSDAHTTEVNAATPDPVIDTMAEQVANIKEKRLGGSMRLGAYPCTLTPDTISARAYGTESISERHRHRYEVNNAYRDRLANGGLVFAGLNHERDLVEIIELPVLDQPSGHPFFVATQFHPELKSRPLAPHPLFIAFIQAAIAKREKSA